MANCTTDETFPNVTLTITNAAGAPAPVQGAPVWASSDDTVLTVVAAADGMTAAIDTVAPGTARVSVTADADLGAGVITITGVSEDVIVARGTSQNASVMALALGVPVAKVVTPPPTP